MRFIELASSTAFLILWTLGLLTGNAMGHGLDGACGSTVQGFDTEFSSHAVSASNNFVSVSNNHSKRDRQSKGSDCDTCPSHCHLQVAVDLSSKDWEQDLTPLATSYFENLSSPANLAFKPPLRPPIL